MSETMTAALKRTPLHGLHRKLGARMAPFAGYEMPIQFKGIVAEHSHARTRAVLFDVSHMGQATLPIECAGALERIVVGDIADLQTGAMRYTLMTNEAGGIIDDLIVVSGGTYLWLIVNAARRGVDFAHIRAHMPAGCELSVRDDRALLALQGPQAAKALARLSPASKLMLFMTSETLRIGDFKCMVCRSGYTGEDGFEIACAAEEAEDLARLLLDEPEVEPAGLGARDTLRLEAGLCLHGQDITERTTPVEARLAWTVGKRRREEGGFLGDEIILRQLIDGVARRRVGIRLAGRASARPGAEIRDADGRPIGQVTSGSFAPSLGHAIAMGYVEAAFAEVGRPVELIVREAPLSGEIVKLPFVPHRYVRP
jgi:aminomethyltransferase